MQNLSFDSLNLSEEVLKGVSELGYTEMTEIQARAIPIVLEGRDVIGRSSTGTGKTAAFGIPAIESIKGSNRPEVLVLSPTRELAMQISEEMSKYSKYKPSVRIATVYGGQSMVIQFRQLRTSNVIIGTPGRIMDHMRRNTLSLENVKMVILDEADEMLNMGFFDDMKTILTQAPEERQTLLFSATMPQAIMNLTKEFQSTPEIIAVDKGQRTLNTISQFYYYVPQSHKMDVLNLLLQNHRPTRSVVFCNTKKMVDDLVEYLNDRKFKSVGLHGDMRQMVRSQVMADYKTGKYQILVATDVAARGIDVDDVEAVFNFDIPTESEYYIHRIGRTGRAGKTGSSFTLATNQTQVRKLREIENFIGAPIKERPIPSVEEIMKLKDEKFNLKLKKILEDEDNSTYFDHVDAFVEEGYELKNIAAALMGMLLGKDRKLIPVVKMLPPVPREQRTSYGSFGKTILRLSIGRNQKIAPNFIVGAIVEKTNISPRAIGKIDIFADHTVIELGTDEAKKVMESMQGDKIKNYTVTFSQIATSSGTKPRSYAGNNRTDVKKSYNSKSSGYNRTGFTKSTEERKPYSKFSGTRRPTKTTD